MLSIRQENRFQVFWLIQASITVAGDGGGKIMSNLGGKKSNFKSLKLLFKSC